MVAYIYLYLYLRNCFGIVINAFIVMELLMKIVIDWSATWFISGWQREDIWGWIGGLIVGCHGNTFTEEYKSLYFVTETIERVHNRSWRENKLQVETEAGEHFSNRFVLFVEIVQCGLAANSYEACHSYKSGDLQKIRPTNHFLENSIPISRKQVHLWRSWSVEASLFHWNISLFLHSEVVMKLHPFWKEIDIWLKNIISINTN